MADRSANNIPRRRRLWLWVVLVVLVVIAILYSRALLESRWALQDGNRLQASDSSDAIRAYRHAVEWYAPGNPYSRQAAERLFQLGMAESEALGDRQMRLNALESLRTGILVTRSVYTPYQDVLVIAEERIAHLRALEVVGHDSEDLQFEQSHQLQLLVASRLRAPKPWWSLVTVIAFLSWIGLTFFGIRGAYRPNGQLNRRHAIVFTCLSVIALTLWIVGLTLV